RYIPMAGMRHSSSGQPGSRASQSQNHDEDRSFRRGAAARPLHFSALHLTEAGLTLDCTLETPELPILAPAPALIRRVPVLMASNRKFVLGAGDSMRRFEG